VFDARQMLAPLATVMPYDPADLLAWNTYMLPDLDAADRMSKGSIPTFSFVAANSTVNAGV
jgi:hypothetical protein